MRSNYNVISQHLSTRGASTSSDAKPRNWAHKPATDRTFTTMVRVVPSMVGAEPDFKPAPDRSWIYRKSAAPMSRDRRTK